MWTIGQILREAVQFFERKGVPMARLEAEILLGHAISVDRVGLFTGFERPLHMREVDDFRGLVLRRIRGEPTAYITGEREFFSLPFFVSPAVLIPRPETEELVQTSLDELDAFHKSAESGEGCTVADIGTGSGCIPVTLAVLRKKLRLVATDISAAALTVAGENARRHGVEGRISYAEGNLVEPLVGLRPEGGFEIVTCNPPYIDPTGDVPVESGVRDYEPETALFTPPGDPLRFYREVLAAVGELLAPRGRVLFEVGLGMANSVAACGKKEGFEEVGRRRDLAGIDRVIVLSPEGQKPAGDGRPPR
jgi:release factor glutamine methyltransferase